MSLGVPLARAIRFAVLVLALGASACGSPAVPDGKLACSTHDECPNGWVCRADGLCWSAPALAAMSADAGDAMVDAALDAMSSDAAVADAADTTDGGDAATASQCAGREGERCDDGSFCTVDDTCTSGVCIGNTPRKCDDGVACNGEETCDEAANRCQPGVITCAEPFSCDLENDECVSGCDDCTINRTCVSDQTVDSQNPCLICDVARARNTYSDNDGASCGDATTAQCTAPDSCSQGVCQPNHVSSGVDCGSGPTECSGQDSCDGQGSCAPNDSPNTQTCGTAPGACAYARQCTGSGACGSLVFKSQDVACDADGNLRTLDHCSGTADSCQVGPNYCDSNRCWNPPPTGQTRCYSNTVEISCPGTAGSASCGTTAFCGQDAQVADPSRAFICKAAGGTSKSCSAAIAAGDMVDDSLSQLTWQRVLPSDFGAACGGDSYGCTWQESLTYCANLNYGGRSDWRLPEMRELLSIANYNSPATPGSDFPASLPGSYWSSTLHKSTGQHVNYCSVESGDCNLQKFDKHLIPLCVTGGPSGPTNNPIRFYVRGVAAERTVFDRATGLEWRYLHEVDTTWSEALAFCEALDYAGHQDWHLPSQAQIYTLVNYDDNKSPTSDFPGTQYYDYWSSTTVGWSPTNAYTVRQNYAYHTLLEKTYTMGIALCVRTP